MSVADLSPVEPVPEPASFLNRELSLLEFNRRVLEQSKDESIPLLERLRYLCIASTNLDEFFEIRVARLQQQVVSATSLAGAPEPTPQEILRDISQVVHRLVDEQYCILNEILIPALEKERIRFVRRTGWNAEQESWVRQYFEKELLPVLSPIGLDPSHPFPRIQNKSLNFIVSLQGRDAFGREGRVAVVQAPRSLPRVIQLPREMGGGPHDFVFLSSIIHNHVNDLFPGMEVTGCYQFRVTRNSELFVDEEEVQDLRDALEGELLSRRYGDSVRLEVADNCTAEMNAYLLTRFELEEIDFYPVNGPVNLSRLLAVPELVNRPDLKYPAFTPGIPRRLRTSKSMFDVLRQGDVLLHHPYESFAPVVEFVQQAAQDPRVLAIKQTLYRTGKDSAIVQALIAAARAGKEVTVVIELRARFDEEANIGLANLLQEAGAHVVYGIVGYKTHAKLILVVRRERLRLRHYVHLGTGNYHDRTARTYTDFGLLTCDDAIGDDAHKVFLQLTSLGRVSRLQKLLQAPFSLHQEFLQRIEREATHARQGRPARIMAKMNALVEPRLIEALYTASQAGVQIDLIVRGICCLRPGVPGLSENIRVRSIIGRFLEHTRVYWFHNNGDEEVFCASADWMERNFFRRVEVAFPIADKTLRNRVIRESLRQYLADNTQAWELLPDGVYRRIAAGSAEPVNAQSTLLRELAQSS
ncbi:MAG: RNA degradosome polyphosphate kinase [Candidatus Muproteobacteria bacterium RBG_16_62_13]|uniref:Polyphosphate kinase n=1 Tax=Candidatus Muproteobacteria bacterium RBG_16_62_13 TaxID=1817756 RepID=A0A1F6T528_9PROT|nr:MAG: RNA degradosome polyphosphate kinase [Candidatus Muproteobacteria bacterium RBG_16_62_13]